MSASPYNTFGSNVAACPRLTYADRSAMSVSNWARNRGLNATAVVRRFWLALEAGQAVLPMPKVTR